MTKIFTCYISVLFGLLAAPLFANPTQSTNNSMKESPNPNWKLLWTEKVDEVKSEARMFVHIKTDAQLLQLASEDDEKVFCIAFRTPPTDSSGIAHVMEHSALCGSEKFPTKEPFVDLLKGSLQTFLNAFTSDDRTMYPVASRNDKDFHNLMDVYLDAVFFPNVKKIPEILMQEGWHYEVNPDTDELTYNGIVYNEMKGVYSSPQNLLYRTIQQSMYPQSTYANDSGGNPDNITELTQEKFIAFHNKFYHPSNSMIFLYGNSDIVEQLAFLDKEYLSKFSKQKIDASVVPQPQFDKPKDVTVDYSVDTGESTDAKTFLSLNYMLPVDLKNAELYFGMDLLTYILVNSEAGQLRRALLDAELGLDVNCSFDSSILQPTFSIIVQNSEPNKKEKFIEIVDSTLKKLVTEGIDRKIIEGALNSTEFSLREFQMSGGYPKGLAVAMNVIDSWSYGGDPLRDMRFEKILKTIRDNVDKNYFENLIQKYLLDNKSSGFVMLKPKQGLEKERADKLAAKLAKIKESLSNEQLENIKREQQVLLARQSAPDKPEDVAKIPRLTIADVDKKAEDIPFRRLTVGDIPVVNTTVDTNKIAYISFYFKAKQQPIAESSSYAALLTELLGRLDTAKYTYADLSNETDLHTGGISTAVGSYDLVGTGGEYDVRISINTKVMLPKVEQGLDLLFEIINNTKFDDTARIKEIIKEMRVNLEQSLMSNGHRFAQTRAASYFSRDDLYDERTGGIEFYKFLKELEKNPNMTEKLQTYANHFLRRENLDFVSITLDEENFDSLKETFAKKFKEGLLTKNSTLTNKPNDPNDKPLGQLNEAVVIPSRVQYVVKAANYKQDGTKYSGKMLVLTNILRTGYLWDNIRVQGGAYGGGVSITRSGIVSLWSYRDPNLKRTVDIYEGVANFLEKLELTDEELTNAIIATIGSLDKPKTPAAKGGTIAMEILAGQKREEVQQRRDEVLSTTLSDLRDFAKMFRDAMKQNNICVFGNEEKLKEDKDLFKTTLRPIE
ncbi:MAG: insulinase family protein [Planctomycetaceae bacterium]|jgi:Zn-dependent M16 (insulinase) family peptidase|nr:insulinase family protein [Planctomycetaceae bacterium]